MEYVESRSCGLKVTLIRDANVCCKGSQSKTKLIKCGVPQGSILGPLLFLLYINDLPNASDQLNFILFADDTNVFFSHKSIQSLLSIANNELIHVAEWFKANELSLNLGKTNYVLSDLIGNPSLLLLPSSPLTIFLLLKSILPNSLGSTLTNI